jgi:hypothetical protein
LAEHLSPVIVSLDWQHAIGLAQQILYTSRVQPATSCNFLARIVASANVQPAGTTGRNPPRIGLQTVQTGSTSTHYQLQINKKRHRVAVAR